MLGEKRLNSRAGGSTFLRALRMGKTESRTHRAAAGGEITVPLQTGRQGQRVGSVPVWRSEGGTIQATGLIVISGH